MSLTPGEARRKNREYFQAFWRVYPRHTHINESENVFSQIVEGTPSTPGVDPLSLIEKARIYASSIGPDDVKWVPAACYWLKDGRYDDVDLFTDKKAAERRWFERCWDNCDVTAVQDRYKEYMPRVNLPPNITEPDAIRRWYKNIAREWIKMMEHKHLDE
jgi:hypothetical protein